MPSFGVLWIACGFILHPSAHQHQGIRINCTTDDSRLLFTAEGDEVPELCASPCMRNGPRNSLFIAAVFCRSIFQPLHCMQSLLIKLTIGDALCISDPEQELGRRFPLLRANWTESETFFSFIRRHPVPPEHTDTHGKQITRIIKTPKEVLLCLLAK